MSEFFRGKNRKKEGFFVRNRDSIFMSLGCLVVLFVAVLALYGLWELFLLVVEAIARTIKNA